MRPFDVATKKLHHNDKDLKHFSQVFSMQFMAKFGACQEEREGTLKIPNLCHDLSGAGVKIAN